MNFVQINTVADNNDLFILHNNTTHTWHCTEQLAEMFPEVVDRVERIHAGEQLKLQADSTMNHKEEAEKKVNEMFAALDEALQNEIEAEIEKEINLLGISQVGCVVDLSSFPLKKDSSRTKSSLNSVVLPTNNLKRQGRKADNANRASREADRRLRGVYKEEVKEAEYPQEWHDIFKVADLEWLVRGGMGNGMCVVDPDTYLLMCVEEMKPQRPRR